jgi:spoIIIJ-associated protein
MVYEFEGRSEREAIETAASQLGLETDEFDVEIVENQSGGLFKKGKVKIRVHTQGQSNSSVVIPTAGRDSLESNHEGDGVVSEDGNDSAMALVKTRQRNVSSAPLMPADEFERKILEWTTEVIGKMGYTAKVSVIFREEKKIGLKIESDNASIIIGKKGKNIDALQLLLNVYVGVLGRDDVKVILDSENYRIRREESLVRIAYDSAEQVRRTGRSILLEPMNPFERRIIHTTLNDIIDVETKSEGEGLYKQVRVMFRGRK